MLLRFISVVSVSSLLVHCSSPPATDAGGAGEAAPNMAPRGSAEPSASEPAGQAELAAQGPAANSKVSNRVREPPDWRFFRDAAREAGFARVHRASKRVGSFADRGAAAMIARGTDGEVTLVVVVAQHVGSTWTVGDVVEVRRWTEDDEQRPIEATLRSADFDADGEPELLLRHPWTQRCKNHGSVAATDLVAYDMVPEVREMLRATVHRDTRTKPDRLHGQVEVRDVNGDRHPDVVIDHRHLEFDAKRKRDVSLADLQSVFAWDSKSDAFVAADDNPALPWTCEPE